MEAWVLDTFGRGFARHFFRPYNEKFWRRPLKELTAEWAAWSIPVPTPEEILRGAKGEEMKGFGYNTKILYPKEQGIRILPDFLFSRLGNTERVHLNTRAVSVEAGKRRVRFDDSREMEYPWLVSSIPLDRLAAMIEDAPEQVKKAAASLKRVNVYGLNVGLKGSFGHHHHWIYFPEDRFVFYRVGYISNYAPSMAPEGYCSLTAEVALRPEERIGEGLMDRVLNDLCQAGIVKNLKDVVLTKPIHIDPGYVVFDADRQAALPKLYDFLMENRIIPVGRYGTWNYMGMEDSILHGLQAADWIRKEGRAGA
jgi:UDP-galactopyranose mutase